MQPSESRFFKYVWRFNALAIAGAAIGVILLSVLRRRPSQFDPAARMPLDDANEVHHG